MTSEWVGIDGVSSSSLIQAGVTERYDPATNLVYDYAWWEILPAPSTQILMRVAPGDQMTVTIFQLSGSLWQIEIVDNTNGQRFATEQTYFGSVGSIEWVVEAPTLVSNLTQTTLGHYIPNVTFTNLRYTGTETTVTEVIMVQGGVTVSVPSAISANGFSVAYGGVPPPPP